MGRSQLQYRPTRGRGQGSRGGRGGGSERPGGGRGGSGRGSRSGGRPLESNAFRYEERNDEDEEESTTDAAVTSSSSRQFFADERQYRDMGDVKESYFRTKAMQQWDADDDDGDEATGTVGVMDFTWIAEQLATVAPSLRYQIDPKYGVDFASEDPVEEETDATSLDESVSDVSNQPKAAKIANLPSSELDDLLAFSSAATTVVSGTTTASASAAVVVVAPEAASTGSGEQDNLEDWLDDVLDM